MANLQDVGTTTIVNRGFVALAVEAGIVTVIQSLVTLGMSQRALLEALVDALETTNPELAAALNLDTLQAILRYMAQAGAAPVVRAVDLPDMLDADGPASVSAARDGGAPTQVNITFSAYPEGYTYEIYRDGVFAKAGEIAASDGWVFEALQGVTVDGAQHTIRVLFVSAEGAITRFGPVATFS